jgi:hypothetical protein
MSEEGPEPQELFEQAEKSHHHSEEGGEDEGHKQFTMRSAITASILAVGAALASLLSGHAANEAILKTVEASDKWSYYQANSTKAHLFESNRALIVALKGEDQAKSEAKAFADKLAKYEKQKDDIKREAEDLEHVSQKEFERHQDCSLSVACFQIGIVLSSVAILARSRWLYAASILAGIAGLVFALIGISTAV